MGFLDVPVRPGQIAGKVDKGSLVLNVKDYGAKGDGATDDTAAIQAAINAAVPGSTIYFPPASSGYIITAGLTITTPNLRFSVGSRDYGTHVKCTVPGVTMLTVKASQFINELTFVGDGGIRGVGSTVTGIDMFGDASANQDCTIGGTFIYLAMPLKLRGRNADVKDASFSNSLAGVQLDGIDAVFHTGSAADGDKRGNQIRGCRFHDVTGKAIELTATAKVVHAIIEGNFFDSGSPTQAIVATGTVSATHNRLTIRGNKMTESTADAISLTYCLNSTVRGNEIYGLAATTGGRGIVLDNCTDVDVSDTMITQVSRSAVVGTNSTRVRLDNIKVRAIGADTATTAHGFDFNSTNTGCEFTNLSVEGADGWGFTGDPVNSSITEAKFNACTLGNINSNTLQADSVFLAAATLASITGTPNLAGLVGVGYPGAWHMDPAAVEQVVGVAPTLPGTWITYDLYVVWAPTTASTGGVVWDVTTSILADGALPSGGAVASPGVATPASGTAGTVSRYKSGTARNRPGYPVVVRVARNATTATDTYPSDAGLLGVQLVKAS